MEEKKPWIITEQSGLKQYCMCARSKKQPYCDGSHKGSGLHPLKVEIDEEKTVAICACGRSQKFPFSDGSHDAMQEP